MCFYNFMSKILKTRIVYKILCLKSYKYSFLHPTYEYFIYNR